MRPRETDRLLANPTSKADFMRRICPSWCVFAFARTPRKRWLFLEQIRLRISLPSANDPRGSSMASVWRHRATWKVVDSSYPKIPMALQLSDGELLTAAGSEGAQALL